MIRSTVCTASVVCNVDSTRCRFRMPRSPSGWSPDRASHRSESRRALAQTCLSASRKFIVSKPTSRWLMIDSCRCEELDRVLDRDDVALACLIDVIDHRRQVVDLPEPVMPVTSTIAASLAARISTTSGRFKSLNENSGLEI